MRVEKRVKREFIMAPTKLYKAENISLELGAESKEVKILNDISLTLHVKEKLSIVGPSGSGKTSLMMILSGLMTPSAGKLIFQDKPIHTLGEDDLARFRHQHVGIVFQNFHLVPSLSALENVMFPLSLGNDPDAKDKAADWLGKVGLGHRLGHMPAQLSGGEQQRVALARALITEPSMILADEPTGNLDQENGAMITELLFEMVQKHDTALVLITHDEKLAQKTDRIVELVDGHITKDTMQKIAA